ncbi:WD40 repeat domain-containing protein [Nostoc sp. UHCC 0870]|uniref:WD40 repeat domain-containing protein n=1 Tax=Nostoc sp. UHCC 0870 TaxID=2914041 RepID=UPI001EDF1399|nr:hypothetical protein [Nostoc sp. UHCC 0870]UKO99596.1 hypothetical protein L6494_07780 [Nostoc sp. UHCC 0870]
MRIGFIPRIKSRGSQHRYDRTIRLWKLKNRPCYDLLETISGHTRAVLAIAFSPNGKILASSQ